MNWQDIRPFPESRAKQIAAAFFESHGLQVEMIDPKTLKPGLKSPDFRVKRNGLTLFHAELKGPSHLLNEESQMYQWSTSYNRIRSNIRTAVKQLVDFDGDHDHLRVRVLMSNHPQMNFNECTDCLTGTVKAGGEQIIRDFRGEQFEEFQDQYSKLDLIIWMQVAFTDESIVSINCYIIGSSPFMAQVQEIAEQLQHA